MSLVKFVSIVSLLLRHAVKSYSRFRGNPLYFGSARGKIECVKMTRFARAKGSKASNEREPEEATPWNQLVKGLNNKQKAENPEVEDDQDVHEEEPIEKGDENVVEEQNGDDSSPAKKKKRQRPKDKCLVCKEKGHLKMDCPTLTEERRTELRELRQMKVERKGQGKGRKKNKANKEEPSEQSPKKKKPFKAEFKDKAGQTVLEGEGTFQGFRVLKDDEKRLKRLQKTLKQQNASKEEMAEALKKERRRAEKALQRSKKAVCYHCRKPGHFVGECPETKLDVKCFKCGAVDHTSKECKAAKDEFAFAVCFICKGVGHLAKACPDNPKGLYPKGGGCRFCGSVEHLKSDCVRKREKDARQEVRADTISSKRHLEDEEDFSLMRKKQKIIKPKKKIVAF